MLKIALPTPCPVLPGACGTCVPIQPPHMVALVEAESPACMGRCIQGIFGAPPLVGVGSAASVAAHQRGIELAGLSHTLYLQHQSWFEALSSFPAPGGRGRHPMNPNQSALGELPWSRTARCGVSSELLQPIPGPETDLIPQPTGVSLPVGPHHSASSGFHQCPKRSFNISRHQNPQHPGAPRGAPCLQEHRSVLQERLQEEGSSLYGEETQ